jgi:hypothetical protein
MIRLVGWLLRLADGEGGKDWAESKRMQTKKRLTLYFVLGDRPSKNKVPVTFLLALVGGM